MGTETGPATCFPSRILKQNGYRSRSLNPPSPLLNIPSAKSLSAFTAAAAFKSMALASSAVPNWPCAKAIGASATTATDAATVMNVRIMLFSSLLGHRALEKDRADRGADRPANDVLQFLKWS